MFYFKGCFVLCTEHPFFYAIIRPYICKAILLHVVTILTPLLLKIMANNKKNRDDAAIAAPAQAATDAPVINLYRKSNKAKKGNAPGKYTRVHAVCEVLKANPAIGRDECLLKADALFTERTGAASNMPETYRRYRSTVHVLKLFGVYSLPTT